MKFINTDFVRYVIMGSMNTGLTYIAYLLVLLIAPYPFAYTVSYVLGIFTSYILNSLLVFREPLSWKKALQYPLVYVVQFFIGLVTLSLLVEALNIDPRFAAIINIIIAVPITFVLSRRIIKPRQNDDTSTNVQSP